MKIKKQKQIQLLTFLPPLILLSPLRIAALYRNFAILGLGKGKSAK
jgi:hypothetical protein